MSILVKIDLSDSLIILLFPRNQKKIPNLVKFNTKNSKIHFFMNKQDTFKKPVYEIYIMNVNLYNEYIIV